MPRILTMESGPYPKADREPRTSISTVKSNVMNNAIYNLNGQKVQKAQRGLYIINGKKVVVK